MPELSEDPSDSINRPKTCVDELVTMDKGIRATWTRSKQYLKLNKKNILINRFITYDTFINLLPSEGRQHMFSTEFLSKCYSSDILHEPLVSNQISVPSTVTSLNECSAHPAKKCYISILNFLHHC